MDSIVQLLQSGGPQLSSSLAQQLIAQGVSPAAARKRIQRGRVSLFHGLAGIRFPHNERFIYLEHQYKSPEFYAALLTAFDSTNSAYGLACGGLALRGGATTVDQFRVSSGAPVALRGHLSSDHILSTLEKLGILERYSLGGQDHFVQFSHRTHEPTRPYAPTRARMQVEDVLISALRDWLRKLNLVSYHAVKTRPTMGKGDSPVFAQVTWDLTAPSYIHPLATWDRGQPVPGFFVADVVLGQEASARHVRAFLAKCDLIWKRPKVRPAIAMLLADRYSKEALLLGRKRGVMIATPEMLFGAEVGATLTDLIGVLTNAATVAATNPAKIESLILKLSAIEGAAITLRGPLFEMIVGMCVMEREGNSIEMGVTMHEPSSNEQVEIDVFRVKGREEVCAYECKGRTPNGQVSEAEIQDWLSRKVPRIYGALRQAERFANSKLIFSFWTSGRFSPEALAALEKAKASIKRYTVEWKDGEAVYSYAHSMSQEYAKRLLNEHFRNHPLSRHFVDGKMPPNSEAEKVSTIA